MEDYLDLLKKQGAINNITFGINMEKFPELTERYSTFTLASFDGNVVTDASLIEKHSVSSPDRWTIKVDAMQIGSSEVNQAFHGTFSL